MATDVQVGAAACQRKDRNAAKDPTKGNVLGKVRTYGLLTLVLTQNQEDVGPYGWQETAWPGVLAR